MPQPLLWVEKPERVVVGLVSGTSADGVDVAVVRVAGPLHAPRVDLLGFREFPYQAELRQAILSACEPRTGRVDLICRLNFALGEVFARAVLGTLEQSGLRPDEVDLIGYAGQTIHHLPDAPPLSGAPAASTLQIGEPGVVAERTGILTVSRFYVQDVAAGGQGAPITPMADYLLFARLGKPMIVQNIGGIANLTYLSGEASPDSVVGFDTGPGNMVIDAIVARVSGGEATYDRDGARAARGRVHEGLLAELLADPFFQQAPPKATGRERYGAAYVERTLERAQAQGIGGDDLIATVTRLTAASIALNYRAFVLDRAPVAEVVAAGGGAYNRTLLAWLQEEVGDIPVKTFEAYGWSSKAREAIGMALIGDLCAAGYPGNLPSVTGARRPVVLGQFVPGRRPEHAEARRG